MSDHKILRRLRMTSYEKCECIFACVQCLYHKRERPMHTQFATCVLPWTVGIPYSSVLLVQHGDFLPLLYWHRH